LNDFLSSETNHPAITGKATETTVKPNAHDNWCFNWIFSNVTQSKHPIAVVSTEI
jgi:hypothetical protein